MNLNKYTITLKRQERRTWRKSRGVGGRGQSSASMFNPSMVICRRLKCYLNLPQSRQVSGSLSALARALGRTNLSGLNEERPDSIRKLFKTVNMLIKH